MIRLRVDVWPKQGKKKIILKFMGKEKIPLELLDLLKFEKNSDLSLLTTKETDNFFFINFKGT